MKRLIDDNIWYIEGNEASNDIPLSSDIGIINDNGKIWLYDVGNNINNMVYLKDKYNIVISHFHLDHIGMVDKINTNKLYVSSESYKHLGSGEIIDKDIYIDNIHIFNIPSTHAKGCLGLEINDYAFVGDSLYGKMIDDKIGYNVSLLYDTIKTLESIKAKYILESHNMGVIEERIKVINRLKEIYNKRIKNEAYIII